MTLRTRGSGEFIRIERKKRKEIECFSAASAKNAEKGPGISKVRHFVNRKSAIRNRQSSIVNRTSSIVPRQSIGFSIPVCYLILYFENTITHQQANTE